MNIVQTTKFKKAVKKLYPNQKKALYKAIENIVENPFTGQEKKENLSGIRVYKFKMIRQLMLLAYTYHDTTITLTLLLFGTHENFYRELEKYTHN